MLLRLGWSKSIFWLFISKPVNQKHGAARAWRSAGRSYYNLWGQTISAFRHIYKTDTWMYEVMRRIGHGKKNCPFGSSGPGWGCGYKPGPCEQPWTFTYLYIKPRTFIEPQTRPRTNDILPIAYCLVYYCPTFLPQWVQKISLDLCSRNILKLVNWDASKSLIRGKLVLYFSLQQPPWRLGVAESPCF